LPFKFNLHRYTSGLSPRPSLSSRPSFNNANWDGHISVESRSGQGQQPEKQQPSMLGRVALIEPNRWEVISLPSGMGSGMGSGPGSSSSKYSQQGPTSSGSWGGDGGQRGGEGSGRGGGGGGDSGGGRGREGGGRGGRGGVATGVDPDELYSLINQSTSELAKAVGLYKLNPVNP
jgi:hypothetical protein